jgi:hypothetical protein
MQIQRINKSYCMTEQHKTELQQVLRSSLGDASLAEYVYLAFELGASFQNNKEKKVPVLLQKMD